MILFEKVVIGKVKNSVATVQLIKLKEIRLW